MRMRLICVASGFILAVLGLALAGSSAVDAQVKTKPKEMAVEPATMLLKVRSPLVG